MCGSSPRLRGAHLVPIVRRRGPRFIPAFAGSARMFLLPCLEESVHPRVCGERRDRTATRQERVGSSPRLRGAHDRPVKAVLNVRFIPAFAGSARRVSPASSSAAVHPRVCGERLHTSQRPMCRYGSSPRLRGAPDGQKTGNAHSRFIPAFAGSACWSVASAVCSTVHPRVCGER